MSPIQIVGCGPGHPDYLTPAAFKAIEQADMLVGAQRLLDNFPEAPGRRIVVQGSMDTVLERIAALNDERICVLVSGDTGLFSLTQLIIKRFGRDRCRLFPGISSLQLACARLLLNWDDLLILSAHGRLPDISEERLAAADKIAILAGSHSAVAWVAEQWDRLSEEYLVVSCENLSLANERIYFFSDSNSLRTADLPSRTILFLLKKGVLE